MCKFLFYKFYARILGFYIKEKTIYYFRELARTRTDLFGTFKIGAILEPDKEAKEPYWFSDIFLEFGHHCNQYNMVQVKKLILPSLDKRRLDWNTWESVGTLVPLNMGRLQVTGFPWRGGSSIIAKVKVVNTYFFS